MFLARFRITESNKHCFKLLLTASPTAQSATGGLGTSSVVGIAVAAFLLGAAITAVGVIVVLR